MRHTLICTTALISSVVAGLTATTLNANGVQYYVPHPEIAKFSTVPAELSSTSLIPFAVVDTQTASTISANYVEAQLKEYSLQDDVYSDYLSSLIYLQGPATSVNGTLNAKYLLSNTCNTSTPLMPGPYFLSPSGSVFKAYRLYYDPNSAFTAGVLQVSADSFTDTGLASSSGQAEAAIPVPCRLYYAKASKCSPLAGKRVVLKDIYHLKGLRTGAASRVYYELYGPQNASAPSVQRLIDQGAVVVGKVKTLQFANGENPTAEWIEVLAPFNPRGDGWSAVAVAAYDWVDFAIGTDTSGSMRFPAAYNGVFGARQSHGGLTTDGIVPVSTSLDTLGLFARSAADHKALVQAWYGKGTYKSYASLPKKVFRTTSTSIGGFPVDVKASQVLYDSFVDKLAGFLGATVVDIDPSAEWRRTGPVKDQELLAYTNMAIAWYEQVQLLQKPFYADWKTYTGKSGLSKIGPKARASFDYGNKNVTEGRYNEALAIKSNFTQWWSETINPPNNETCLTRRGVCGLPDYAVPIGQVEYTNRLTGLNERLPVSISIGAARGCDWMLSQLMAELEHAGITSAVKTGQLAQDTKDLGDLVVSSFQAYKVTPVEFYT
ncbi:uncharacterized protein E0L32_003792 [Thyridium curvatum]|uniref:Amidase domain-containing protein n=1 Tax=Thyridium curvatum TaxID=1093900 RepID=A0A507BIL2_9PEZI|nr:uncharacterized protein E0L32_003792 [Thyridium curvatum]TPX16498.1 hypothetical protein E0L32_003792 [Thyridium curvatum]